MPISFTRLAALTATLLLSGGAAAIEPVRVSGAVPDAATKARIVERLRELYPDRDLVDELQVQKLRSPALWGEQALRLLRPELRQVSGGSLRLHGHQISLSGKVDSASQVEQLPALLRSQLLSGDYQLRPQLRSAGTAAPADQAQLDALLARRSIEFEPGKDVLTAEGLAVLAELLPLLKQFGAERRFEIVGHTDSDGAEQANLLLSQARAEAVRRYLLAAGLSAAQLQASGVGASRPLASNASAEGKSRNRRIEIRVLA